MAVFDNPSDNSAPTNHSESPNPLVSLDTQVDIDVGDVTGILDDCYEPNDCTAVAVNADICADPSLNADVGLCVVVDLPDISIPDHVCGSDHTC